MGLTDRVRSIGLIDLIGSAPILASGWRGLGRRYPAFAAPLAMFATFAAVSALHCNSGIDARMRFLSP
jgi:hypothetical protein